MRTPHNERLTPAIDDADAAPVKVPERRCILSRDTRVRGELTRLALSPDGRVHPDVQARAPGRGAWIGVDRTGLEKALADGTLKKALCRAFGTGAVEVPADLPEGIEQALTRVLLDRLGLELRAGNLLLGSQRIDKAAREGRVAVLFHASDASPDGAAKLDQAWRVGSDLEGSGRTGARLPLDRAALSVALGRENVVHLALVDEGAGQRIAALVKRLADFARTGLPGDDAQERGGQNDAADTDGSVEPEILKD